MKHDTQHLEFLISQYVDGTLDAGSRKTIEQQLLTDSVAKDIYKDQRETQDLLDDWGNRLPLINWNAFDEKLADRLEKECPAAPAVAAPWRKWIRPAAIAASLAIAVGTGYLFRAMQGGNGLQTGTEVASGQAAVTKVAVERPGSGRPLMMKVDYSKNLPARTEPVAKGSVVFPPDMNEAITTAAQEGGGSWTASRDEPTGAVRATTEPATRPDDSQLQ